MTPKAYEKAKELDYSVDTLYALSLLEETGICVVPADGFGKFTFLCLVQILTPFVGQKEGRSGFRTTFLPPEDKIIQAVDDFAQHHKLFIEKYS